MSSLIKNGLMVLTMGVGILFAQTTGADQTTLDTNGPSMKMYFHGGINDYMMFQPWVPKTQASYAGVWILFFLLGVLLEGFLVLSGNVVAKWMTETESFNGESAFGLDSNPSQPPATKRFFELSPVISWGKALILTWFKFVESTLAYFLMLVTMIYNVGLFFSVITGHSVGVFLFSRFRAKGIVLTDSDPDHAGTSGTNAPLSQKHILGKGVNDLASAHSQESVQAEVIPSTSCH